MYHNRYTQAVSRIKAPEGAVEKMLKTAEKCDSEFLRQYPFVGVVDVPVEVNRALKPVIEADDRVMRKHKQFVSSVMRNFHLQIVLYAFKAIAEGIIF